MLCEWTDKRQQIARGMGPGGPTLEQITPRALALIWTPFQTQALLGASSQWNSCAWPQLTTSRWNVCFLDWTESRWLSGSSGVSSLLYEASAHLHWPGVFACFSWRFALCGWLLGSVAIWSLCLPFFFLAIAPAQLLYAFLIHIVTFPTQTFWWMMIWQVSKQGTKSVINSCSDVFLQGEEAKVIILSTTRYVILFQKSLIMLNLWLFEIEMWKASAYIFWQKRVIFSMEPLKISVLILRELSSPLWSFMLMQCARKLVSTRYGLEKTSTTSHHQGQESGALLLALLIPIDFYYVCFSGHTVPRA